jgi:tellurite resistance protein TerC
MHARFSYLQEGLAIILAFVGVKMIIAQKPIEYHIPTATSLLVIALVLGVSILMSLQRKPHGDTIELVEDEAEPLPPANER